MNRGNIPNQRNILLGYLRELFEDIRGASQQQNSEKSKDRVLPLKVTLKELYKGKKATVKFEKKIICVDCDGRGGKERAGQQCRNCKGIGKVTTIHQGLFGVAQKVQAECDKCKGSGTIFDQKDECRKCIGQGMLQEQKVIQVVISPGMHDDQEILFEAEGDQERGTSEVGDLIVVLKVKPHEEFERQGDDLIMKRTITLTEALCGLSIKITHLDGRKVLFKNEPGKVIKQNSIHQIAGQGMPIKGTKNRGNLYIVFEVFFPEQSFMGENDYKKLESFLERRPIESLPITGKNVKAVSLVAFDPFKHKNSDKSSRKACNSDEGDFFYKMF